MKKNKHSGFHIIQDPKICRLVEAVVREKMDVL